MPAPKPFPEYQRQLLADRIELSRKVAELKELLEGEAGKQLGLEEKVWVTVQLTHLTHAVTCCDERIAIHRAALTPQDKSERLAQVGGWCYTGDHAMWRSPSGALYLAHAPHFFTRVDAVTFFIQRMSYTNRQIYIALSDPLNLPPLSEWTEDTLSQVVELLGQQVLQIW